MDTFGLSKTGYRLEGKFKPTIDSNITMDLREIFDTVTHDIHELLHNVVVFTMDSTQSEFMEDFSNESKKNGTTNIEITTKYHNNLGKCFSVRPKNHVIKLGVVAIDVVARMGIYVYFGHPGQYMYNTKTKVQNLYRVITFKVAIYNYLEYYNFLMSTNLFLGKL